MRRWVLVVAWAGWIFVASTGWFSGEHTRVMVPLLAWLLPGVDHATVEAVHAFVRKLAHFGEYWVLGVLIERALRADRPWRPAHSAAAVLLATLYAASDELHQHFVPGRTGSGHDVLLDAAGALAGQLVRVARARSGTTRRRVRARA